MKKKYLKGILVLIMLGCTTSLVLFEILNGFVIPSKLPEEPQTTISDFEKGTILYQNNLSNEADVDGWVMEGPGIIDFSNGHMKMESPNEEFHYVFWCPENFPNRFIAEWYVQNLETDAGLLIVFFAAEGLKGEDLFDPTLKSRDGTFTDYTRGDIQNYHISYYANGRDDPGRLTTNLRRNKGFNLVQEGRDGIPLRSTDTHKITLVKADNHIVMFIDNREVINWVDSGKIDGDAHGEGKIGFRQMKWSHFIYSNFTVFELN